MGNEIIKETTGRFGLETINERGEKLIKFLYSEPIVCSQHCISATDHYQNQIDYISCTHRWNSAVQVARTIPAADCRSDHELLIATARVKLRKSEEQRRGQPIFDLEHIPAGYKPVAVKELETIELRNRDPDNLWDQIRKLITEATTKNIQRKRSQTGLKWLTEKTIKIAEERWEENKQETGKKKED